MSSGRPESLACVVLGAGEGRRLHPFTIATPKPMLTILDRPIVDYLLDRVWALGDVSIFVNLYHAADVLARHLAAVNHSRLLWRKETELTGPAGALRLFAEELARFQTVLVLSGDVIFADPLDRLVESHRASGADITFAVTEVTKAHRFGVLELDARDRVLRAREKPDLPPHERHWISAGVYCLESRLLADIPAGRVFDFAADLAPALIASSRPVQGYRLRGYWNDLGWPSSLREANLAAVAGQLGPIGDGNIHIGENVQIGPEAEIVGPSVLGRDSVIGAGSWIHNSVLLPGTSISPGTVLIDGIVGPRFRQSEGD